MAQDCMWPVFFFFFQAEDGIRDVAVTGVQTCALPISAAPFEHLRSSMANTDPDAFEGATEAATEGPGCPFAAMVNEGTAPARVPWTAEAEARVERIPSFIRPMADARSSGSPRSTATRPSPKP